MVQKLKLKPSLVLAVAGTAFASAAHAQSSVTLYGVADVAIEAINHVPPATPGGASGTQIGMISGGAMMPRFGLKGREDLGGGWGAIFKLETYYQINNGTLYRNLQYYGSSYVGVENSSYGQLLFGRNTGVFYDFQYYYDPGLVARYSLSPFDPAFAGRANNSIKYNGTFGPVAVSGLYSFGYTGTEGTNGEVPGNYKVGKEYSFRLNYAASVVSVGVAYDHQNGTTIPTQSNVTDRGIVGASLTLGRSKTIAGFRYLRSTTGEAIAINKVAYAGEIFNFTPTLRASASYYRSFNAGNNSALSDYFALFVDYNLSKATDIYLNAGYVHNRGGATLGLVPGQLVEANVGQTGALIGIRHLF